MSEKNMETLAKELLYAPENPTDANKALLDEANEFCKGYMQFLDASKTEREVVAYSEKLLIEAGYELFDDTKTYNAGDKVYFINRGKCVVAATIGSESMDKGFRLNIAHIDSPRLDLKPNPLYEKAHFSLLKTHYYGGIRKYQWGARPLAIHGVFCKPNGETVKVCIGEDAADPVFCITDLLPHLGQEQNERKLGEGIKGEELNLMIGTERVEDESVKEGVKLNAMILLHEKYGIVERDFNRAEIEIVPAGTCREVGFDRAMIGGYGQDDRVEAYPSLIAEINTKNPAFTTVCVLTDKEETGSDGVTGMQSAYTFHFLQQLCRMQGADYIRACQHSLCLSADVTAAFDPTWDSAYEPMNSTYLGRGVAFAKYTGARGKGGTSDACAELVAYVTGLCDDNGITWQLGEMGRIDLGGGGTIAKYVANRGIDTLDIGVPVLSMHSPFELTHKADILMLYKTLYACNNAKA